MKVACPNCGDSQEVTVEHGAAAARAKCGRCGTSFLVRVKEKGKEQEAGDDQKLFAWFVRKANGSLFSFPGDKQLHQGIRRGFVEVSDEISADGATWTQISMLPILAGFMEKWKRDDETREHPERAEALATVPREPEAAVTSVKVSGDEPIALPAAPVPAHLSQAAREATRRELEHWKVSGQGAAQGPPPPVPEAQLPSPAQATAAPSTLPSAQREPGAAARSSEPPAAPGDGKPARRPITQRELDWGKEWQPDKTYKDEATGLTLMMRRRRRITVVIALVAIVGTAGALLGMYKLHDYFQVKREQADQTVPPQPDKNEQATPAAAAEKEGASRSADGGADAGTGQAASATAPGAEAGQPATAPGAEAGQPATAPGAEAGQPATAPGAEAGQAASASGMARGPLVVTGGPSLASLAPPKGNVAAESGGPASTGESGVPAAGDGQEAAGKEAAGKEAAGKEAAGKEAAGKEEKGKGEKGKGEKGKGEKGKGEKGKEDGSESEAEPRGFDSLMSKADRLRKDDKCGKALEYYHKAAELKPGYAEVQYKLGDCYRRTGRCSAAVKHYEQAISASGFQQAYIGVAKCYIEMGDKGAAKKRLEEGLKRHDDGIMKMMIEQL